MYCKTVLSLACSCVCLWFVGLFLTCDFGACLHTFFHEMSCFAKHFFLHSVCIVIQCCFQKPSDMFTLCDMFTHEMMLWHLCD